MATVILRPDTEISSGSWNNESGSGFNVAKINDSSNSTYVYNASANQSFRVSLDNTSGLAGATFNNFVVTAIFQKHGGKGADASFEVNIGDSSSITTFGSISDTTFVTTSSSPTTINAGSINFAGGVSASDIDDMRVEVVCTDSTQSRIFELFVTIDYTSGGGSGYGNDINSVASSTIGKVNSVATANINKIIGVS